jgi:hypothetical protein
MRRVKDRERKYLSRKTKAGRLKRRLEYCAMAKKRLALPSALEGLSGFDRKAAGEELRSAAMAGATKPEYLCRGSRTEVRQGVTDHDSQTGVEGPARAPPAEERVVVD